jgi:hypothetical protein
MQLESALSIMGSAGKMFIRGSQGAWIFPCTFQSPCRHSREVCFILMKDRNGSQYAVNITIISNL